MTTTNTTPAKKGFIPVMLTPFTETGKIDFNALTGLTEFYLEAGAAGLFANCLSSEMFELDEAERIQLIEHVLKVTNGSVPVVATGTFGGPIAKQAEFVNRVADTGVQAVIGITGLLADENESDEVFNGRVEELMQLTGNVPLGFYECPVPYKRLISPEQLHQFVSTGQVTYHKDTCLDIEQIKAKLNGTNSQHGFGLYDAYMVHAVESLKAGSAGLSCIQGNYFPELVVWLCDNYNNDTLATEVDRVQQFFISNMDVMHNVYPKVAKYYLQKRGVKMTGYTRRNVGDISSDVKEQVDKLYQDYNALQHELQIKSVM
ncbi:dihydrodipicolinate synthase family protein [Mucilaginibacter aquatilis]|uniref:Dihydrodipicolinate synthase family protein n=1 Tax=Mucilaginibacter aquatilis TaxID=1517760 RepID=A0A6I4IPI7_9SPHI|nr:dihydrodipicolinate synthase family protein [Mucilaginibacter aquatilis]MVN90073.1 dihydrodipicolinate synthase family protein [Mucilaginibacter aquatilis]